MDPKLDTPELHNWLLHNPGTVARITKITNALCDAANDMDPSPPNSGKIQNPNFGVYISEAGDRVRGYVHPLGRTGLHIEAGHSVLLKAISFVMGAK
jgi:hypothetical protein